MQEIDDNMDELMKEKEEYHKMGMRSTKGGFGGAGQFDAKSQMSGATSGTRAVNSNNAYLYAAGDQQKIQDINERLQAFNPTLAGSAMMSNDNYDREAQILPSHKREKFNKNRGDDAQDRTDAQSVISMGSNISNYSRKSGLSMLDMGSILSIGGTSKGSQKMPGIKSLRENAEKRQEKAQMMRIDAELARL